MLNKNNKVVLKHKDNKIRFKMPAKDIPIAVDESEIPYISIYYYPSRQTIYDDFIIPLYVTDFYQREYAYDDYSARFKMRYEVDGAVEYVENVSAGDFDLNLGKLSKGEHYYTVQIEDSQGRVSRRICNDILVVDPAEYEIKPSEIYEMTLSDLTKYNLNNQNSKVVEDMVNNRVGLTQLFKDKQEEGYRKIVLLNGTYRVNRTTRLGTGINTCISIPTNFTVDMNSSTFKMHEYNDADYGTVSRLDNLLVKMYDCFDSHLVNGILEGDYFERQENDWLASENGQQNNTFYAYGGMYCSLDNITIKQTTGYNICCSHAGGFDTSNLGEWLDDSSIVNGEVVFNAGYVTNSIKPISSNLINGKYIVASVWLMAGGLNSKYWDMDFHFYNSNQEFIETIKVYQFTRCRIPEGAKYFRMTFRGKSSEINHLSIHNMNVCRNFEINNCHWVDNRTCSAPFQCQHFAFNDCTFTRSGQSITPCEIDLEDGWEQTQDVFVRNCEVLENIGRIDIIDCAGINHVIENCKNIGYEGRYRINGITFRNNINSVLDMTIGWMTGNTARFYNNEINGVWLRKTEPNFFNNEKTHVFIKNNKIASYIEEGEDFYTFLESEIVEYGIIQKSNFSKCIIYRKGSNAFIFGDLLYDKCVFKLSDGELFSKFSFNKENVIRIYRDCIYEAPCQFVSHYYFNSGEWIRCNFKDTLLIQPKSENAMGQIKFDNCTFEKEVTIDSGSSTYIQFNNCEFLGGIKYVGTSEERCEFN